MRSGSIELSRRESSRGTLSKPFAELAEVGRLRSVLGGEVSETRVQPVERTRFTGLGTPPERYTIDEPVVSSRMVSPAERVQARRLLPGAEEAVYLAQEQLEEAKAMHETATRARQQAALEAGTKLVRAELPGLIRELRAVQARMQEYAAKMAALDSDLGRRHFMESVWPYLLPGEGFDFFVGYVGETFLR